MKVRVLALLMLFALAGGALTVRADDAGSGDQLLVIFDENGTATYQVTAGTPLINGYTSDSGTLDYEVATDPGPGGIVADALIYLLPTTVESGDVPICAPAPFSCTPSVSDGSPAASDWIGLLRFENSTGSDLSSVFSFDATQMVYYSDVGAGELADVGLPTEIYQNGGPVVENTSYGVDWQPGGGPYPDYNEYQVYSVVTYVPAVPEPASLFLLGTGLVAIGRTLRRKKSA